MSLSTLLSADAEATNRRVIAARGCAKTSYTSPSSTTRPFSITATRRQMDLMTAISCVMSTMVSPELAVQIAEQVQNGLRRVRIEGAGRLVGEQHPRLVRQRAGRWRRAASARRKAGRVHVRLVAQINQIQQLKHARLHIGLLHAGVAQRIGDVFKHGRTIQQVEMLEDHADAPPHRAELSFRSASCPARRRPCRP